MIYVLVEITGFNALKKMNPVFTDHITADLNKILESNICISRKQYGSLFIYSYTPGLKDIKRLFADARETYRSLLSFKDELRGFTVFIDHAKGILSKLQRKSVMRKMYGIWESNSFCISHDAYDLFSRMAEFVDCDSCYKLVAPESVNQGDEKSIKEFLTEMPEIGTLLDDFEPLLNNEKKGLFFYYGSQVTGISYLAYSMADAVEGKTKFPRVIIYPEENDYSEFHPFLRCLQSDLLEQIPYLLSVTEKKVWDQFLTIIQGGGIPLCEEDAVIIFTLYLTAYSRFTRRKNLPFIIYFMDVDRFHERTLEIAADIMEEFSRSTDIIPVLFSGNPDVPACFHNFSVIKHLSEEWHSQGNYSPVSNFHSYLLGKRKGTKHVGLQATKTIMDDFDSFTRRILYIATLLNGLLSPEEIINMLTEENLERIKYDRAFNDLKAYGFLYPDHSIPVFPGLLVELRKIHGEVENRFFKKLEKVYAEKGNSAPRVYMSLAGVFNEIGEAEAEIAYTFHAVRALIDVRKSEDAVTLLKEVSQRIKKSPVENAENIRIHDQLFLRAALLDARDELAHDFYQTVLSSGESRNNQITLNRNIILSEYYYTKYDHKRALKQAKMALIQIQKSDNPPVESAVNILLGKIMLGMQRIDEAKDYFRISREMLSPSRSHPQNVIIYYLESITHYIYGNISESLRLVEMGTAAADLQGLREWQLLYCFAAGRIYFDLGRYSDAARLFSDCLTLADIYNFHESISSIYPWLARSYIYGGIREKGKQILSDFGNSAEGLFFTAEYLYFEGRFPEALDTVKEALGMEKDAIRVFRSPDFVLKESGFEYIEDLVFIMEDGHGVLYHLLQAFHAFLSVLVDKSAHGSEELVRLTRDGKLSDIDPYNGFYFFLHALCIPEKPGTDDIDRLTLLSKALRHVQTIASRIDVPGERIEYLNSNYWNAQLLSAGRKNKLL